MPRESFTRRNAVVSVVLLLSAAGAQFAPADDTVRFNRDIRPILSEQCFFCHGPDASHREADLRFDVEQSAKADLGGYHAILPGNVDDSEMFRRITTTDDEERMPPPESGKSLTAEQIGLLRRWIEQGAPYEAHWSFVAPERPPLPAVNDTVWPANPVDRFILRRLEARGWKPSPEANRRTLVRRIYFDVIGLPPAGSEIESFVHDRRPGAYARMVDRLLASPHFGERLAVYWLDLVRYADTVGYHGDQEHHISPYRDYVVRAFNDNLPFDQFTIEQLAGDLLPEATIDQIIATGYNRTLQTSHEGGVQDKEYLAKYAADRVRNVSNVWMGATMGCSECHDHKYDPYTQRDFYSLAAFFADVKETGSFPGSPNSTPTRRDPEIDVLSVVDRARVQTIHARIEQLQTQEGDEDASQVARQNLASLRAELKQLNDRKLRTMVTVAAQPRMVRVLGRGDWMDESGPTVQPAVPHFLEPLDVGQRRATRLDLARWLTSARHPQTSRVFVNRLWYLLFGAGLTRSLDDTGSQGQWPTHPELLDWLAVEFVDSGWDVKHMVRLIVNSSTYRQSSLISPGTSDPDNRWLARQSRFRLPAEMIRDNALAVSGLLVQRIGGASARPYQPAGYYANLNFPKRKYTADKDQGQYRRGVYTHWQRQFLHPMLKAFDAPSREECTAQRPVSNTPLAALTLLNDPTFVEAARVLAVRILCEGGQTPRDRIRWSWRQVAGRDPSQPEILLLEQLQQLRKQQFAADPEAAAKLTAAGLAAQPNDLDPVELAAWTSVARALLNLSETITRN